MKKEVDSNVSEATQIVDLLSELNNKVRLDKSLTYVSEEQYEQLAKGINDLSINIYNHKLVSDESNDRMDELTDVMTSIAALDFSKTATVTDEENHLDYIAIGLNLMSGQLRKSTAILKMFGNIIEHSKDLIIVTDTKGKIEYLNTSAAEKLGYTKEELLSMQATKIFSFRGFLKQLKEIKKSGKIIIKLNHKNGKYFPVAVSAKRTHNLENKPENIILYIPSVQLSFGKLKGLYQVINFIVKADENEVEKHQYKEALKMVGEEINEMVS